MAIIFECRCGKPLQSSEQFAGRKMRCPSCGTILTIPTASGMEPSEPDKPAAGESAAPPQQQAPATMIPPDQPSPEPPPVPQPPPIQEPPPMSSPPIQQPPPIPTPAPPESEPLQREISIPKAPPPAPAPEIPPFASTMFSQPPPAKAPKKAIKSPWTDVSLSQEITPWPEHDNVRVGDVTKNRRSGDGKVLSLVVFLIVVAAYFTGLYFISDLPGYF